MKTLYLIFALSLVSALSFGGEFLVKNKHLFYGYNIGNSNPMYTMVNEVPDGQSGVTALTVGLDGNIYGGTSATENKTCYVLMYKVTSNLVTAFAPLDKKIRYQTRINNALATGGDGYIYGGTSVYEDETFKQTDEMRNPKYEGGHLFRFKEGKLDVEDLGLVSPQEGIRTITADPKRAKIYGLLEPGYKFFVYDVKMKRVTVKKDVDLLKEKEYSNVYARLVELGKALVVSKDGRVWGSAYNSRLFAYTPESDKLEVTDITFPNCLGHEDRDGVSAFATADDGTIYGGTLSDGALFKFLPEKGKTYYLGKPGAATWVRSLCIAKNGKVVGVLGQKGFPAQVFTYEDGVYALLGEIRTTIFKTDYNWYASDLEPCVYLKDMGTVMFGNSGRIGKLFSYYNN